jgi:hypothetical protein
LDCIGNWETENKQQNQAMKYFVDRDILFGQKILWMNGSILWIGIKVLF